MKRLSLASVLLVLLPLGCGDDDPTVDPDAPTYYADVAPLVQRECLTCHVEGGIGPFRLDSYDAVVEQASAVVSAVTSGYMPPWQPSRECGEIVGERGLTSEERQVFIAWNAGGQPMGDPADAPDPLEDPLIDFTPTARATIGGGGYVPDITRPDDYRCFLLDMPIEETSYLTGSWVQPDQQDVVHHVLVYALAPEDSAAAEAADAADATEGYTCFGGPLPGAGGVPPTQLGAWVPGQLPNRLAEGRGIRIEAGSRIVMQVHYNTLETSSPADETEFQAVLTTATPTVLVQTLPLPILRLEIPAGNANVVESAVFRNWTDEPMTITGLSPHMHLLGTTFSARFMPAIGAAGESQCLLEIPQWDFQWQQGYRRPADAPVVLQPGEGIEVTCTYDNSATNQPVVNGMQQAPTDVAWGEGTLDEMCILYISREVPFADAPPVSSVDECTTATLDACRAECGDSLSCLYSCDALTVNRECQNCTTGQIVECVRATTECGLQWLGLGDCAYQCTITANLLGGDLDHCMSTECGAAYESMLACTDALVAAGTCDSYLSTCGEGFAPAP